MRNRHLILLAGGLMLAASASGQRVQTPGGAVNGSAIGYGPKDGAWTAVTPASPLPVTTMPAQAASTSTPLAGSSATTQTVGPFTPQLGRPINLRLTGTWTGSAQLLRSVDAGATRTPLTIGGSSWGSYGANANEPVWTETEAGATYYLALTVSSGTVTYRVAQ